MEKIDSYKVTLPSFEGPLDLLLHLVKENKVDIFNIPIALITDQYLEYVRMMEMLDLNVAGEFIVMAATLIHLKSRLLLPKDETAEQEDALDAQSAQAELVRRLAEYRIFKEAA